MTRMTRRSVLAFGTATAAGLLAGPAVGAPAGAQPPKPPAGPPDAAQAWRSLAAGNARFAGEFQVHPHQDLAWRQTLINTQHPFACVLGCADSRIPPELIFDQGLGDLFTIRSAGEVLDDAVVGSIEYAVDHLHVPLVVVLGHTNCGAVRAAVDLVRGHDSFTGAVSTLARAIEAAVRATPPNPDDEAFLTACVRTQGRRVATELAERSTVVRDSGVIIATAVFDLSSGRVERLE